MSNSMAQTVNLKRLTAEFWRPLSLAPGLQNVRKTRGTPANYKHRDGGPREEAKQMDYDAKNSDGKPKNIDRRLDNDCEIPSDLVFENLRAFSDWLTLDLEKLEAAYQNFSTVRSSRSFVGR